MNDLERAAGRLRALLEGAKPPTGSVARADLLTEAAPLIPLLMELPADALAGGDYASFQFRECFTVLSLLGRRLALLDLTPSTAIEVVRLILASTEGEANPLPTRFSQRAVEAAVEGFVLGREERVTEASEARAARHLQPLRIDESAFALILTGVHEPAVFGDCVDALGRAMLDTGIEIAIVDLSQLGEPNGERVAAILAADEIARMLGGVCIFSGIDSRWRAAARDAGIELDALQIAPNLGDALASARATSQRTAEDRKLNWRGLIERLRR